MNVFVKDNDFITINNERILSAYAIQPRYKPETKKQDKDENADVNAKTKDFLMAVNLYQYQETATEIYKRANLSAGTGSRIAGYCEKNILIKILQVQSGRGCPKYPVLLPKAYELLGIEEKKFCGRGAGPEHVLEQYRIAGHFSAFKPEIELYRGGKCSDVGLQTNEYLLCFEVAMTSVHEKENIEKDFQLAKADYVIVACKNSKVLKDVQNIISEMPETIRQKTKALLISVLLNTKPDEFIESLFQGEINI